MLKVLVVDDHPIIRKGLIEILRGSGPYDVAEAGTGAEALSLVQAQNWDIVVLDLILPDQSGAQILTQIKQLRPNLPTIILTARPDYAYVELCFRLGASGYLRKEAAPDELVTAIQQTLRGKRYYGAGVPRDGDGPGGV